MSFKDRAPKVPKGNQEYSTNLFINVSDKYGHRKAGQHSFDLTKRKVIKEPLKACFEFIETASLEMSQGSLSPVVALKIGDGSQNSIGRSSSVSGGFETFNINIDGGLSVSRGLQTSKNQETSVSYSCNNLPDKHTCHHYKQKKRQVIYLKTLHYTDSCGEDSPEILSPTKISKDIIVRDTIVWPNDKPLPLSPKTEILLTSTHPKCMYP